MPFSFKGAAFLKRVAFLKWLAVGISLYFIIYAHLHSSHEDYFYKDQVAVLAYHHISDQVKGDVTITPELFKEQLKDLRDRGYSFISLSEFRAFMAGGKVQPNAVLVTFDDGYRSFYTDAYPILRKLRIPAVNFVITKDLDNPLAPRLPALSRDEIRLMSKETKAIDFQCHSNNLHSKTPGGSPLLTTKLTSEGSLETEEQFNKRIYDDTQVCRSRLEELEQTSVDTYAYPFGAFSKESIYSMQQAGISYAFTTVNEMVTRDTNPTEIPRINAGSPYIKFNSLNNLIMRRIVTPLPPTHRVLLKKVVKQLGGHLMAKDDKLIIEMDHETWTIDKKELKALSDDGRSVLLHEPLTIIDKRNYIELQDLEAILGYRIVYNANTDQYMRRYTPKV
jgi:peptidoglycan/xylan/chitin deacetylase (PgdA/CDA1 family)